MSKVIEFHQLTKLYDGNAAVNELTLSINKGEIFGLLGPNGAGKTTTILMLLGLIEPTDGSIQVKDIDPVRRPIEVKKQIGRASCRERVEIWEVEAGVNGKQEKISR